MSKEQEAYKLAMRWHGEQMYGGKPYEFHLQAVRDALVEFGHKDEDLLCAAWLHDIIEDTDCPVRHIADSFGPNVLHLVWMVTGFGKNRKERAADMYAKMDAFADLPPKLLKCADRIANMRASKGTDLEQMYLKAWKDFYSNVACYLPRGLMMDELIRLHEE